ncbi:MAG: hypothetical protein RI942_1492, partial [Pseudomonadota bacterium]
MLDKFARAFCEKHPTIVEFHLVRRTSEHIFFMTIMLQIYCKPTGKALPYVCYSGITTSLHRCETVEMTDNSRGVGTMIKKLI